MEYEEEGGYPGSFPECGAIFMSNAETKKECLKRNLFGLPSSEANFVRRIQTGMILFLFEFEKRELYGVYQACSNGEMDIMPHAFSSSGKRYPAQVRFKVVWYCKPLSEHEFRDAIKENYYSNKKFNFGLSATQVRKLLVLFKSRKLENTGPSRPIRGQTSLIGIKERISGNEEFSSRCREEKFIEEGCPDYTFNEYNGNSPTDSKRLDDKRFQNNYFDRNKGVTDDSMNLTESEVGLEYDVHPNLRDSLYSSRRPSEDNQFLHRDTLYSNHIETAIAPTKSGDRLARVPRESEDGRFQMRDIRGDTHTPSHDGFRLDDRVESFETPQTGFQRPIDDQRSFKDPKVDYGHNLVGHPEPGIPAIHVLRRTSDDDDQLYRNDMIKIGHPIDDAIRPIVSNRLDESERVTATRRHIPAEHFQGSLVHDGKSNYQNRFAGRISQATETLINNGFGPITSVQPAELHQPRQQPAFNSNKTLPEAYYSLSQNQHKTSLLFPSSKEENRFGTYYPTSSAMEKNTYEILKPLSHDSVHTRAAPYDPDFPHVVGGSSHSVQYFPHHSRDKNEIAEELGPQYNGALGRISEVPLHDNEDIHSRPHRIIGNSLLSGQYHGMMEEPLISHEIYENPLTNSRRSIYESRNISTSVRLDERIASQDRVDRGYRENVTDQDLFVNYGMGRAHSGS